MKNLRRVELVDLASLPYVVLEPFHVRLGLMHMLKFKNKMLPLPETTHPTHKNLHHDYAVELAKKACCGVCGHRLVGEAIFISYTSRKYAGEHRVVRACSDPPMHRDCAELSKKMCPHLNLSGSIVETFVVSSYSARLSDDLGDMGLYTWRVKDQLEYTIRRV